MFDWFLNTPLPYAHSLRECLCDIKLYYDLILSKFSIAKNSSYELPKSLPRVNKLSTTNRRDTGLISEVFYRMK